MTSKLVIILALAGSLSAAGWAQATAPTAPAAPAKAASEASSAVTKIGVVNLQAAIAYTNEGQRDLAALQKKFEPTQIELKNSNDEIDSLKKQLDATQDKLSDDERASRVKSIQDKQNALQRKYEDWQNDVSAQQNDVAEKILKQMGPILDEYAKKNGYSLVVDVSNQNTPILWASEGTNITQALIDAYNAKSGVPAPAAAPAAKPAASGASTPAAPAKKPAATATPAK